VHDVAAGTVHWCWTRVQQGSKSLVSRKPSQRVHATSLVVYAVLEDFRGLELPRTRTRTRTRTWKLVLERILETRTLLEDNNTDKTAERIIEILSRSDRTIILVFRHQRSLRKSEGVTPNRGAKYKGGSDFRPICGYISETVIDRGIVTMEDEYKVVCALSNSAAFDDLEWPRTPVSRSQNSLKANISQTVHPCLLL